MAPLFPGSGGVLARSSLVNDTSAILATGMPCADKQHHLGPPPGHHRPSAPAVDPQQPPTLVTIDLTNLHTFSHVIIPARSAAQGSTHATNRHEADVVSARVSSASY